MHLVCLRVVSLMFVGLLVVTPVRAQEGDGEPDVQSLSKASQLSERLADEVERHPYRYASTLREAHEVAAALRNARDDQDRTGSAAPRAERAARAALDTQMRREVLRILLEHAGRSGSTATNSEGEAAQQTEQQPEAEAADVQTLAAGNDEGGGAGGDGAATPLPGGEGSSEGMGESFTPDLTSGEGKYTIPLAVPPGRVGIQPELALAYSTTDANSFVGFGWSLGVEFIARKTDRGTPRYQRAADGLYHPEEDRFVFGGQELVPVDSALVSRVEGFGAVVPADLRGYQEYRPHLSGSGERFFRAPDESRWVVLNQDGGRAEYGVIPDGQGPAGVASWSRAALIRDPRNPQHVFRWNLTRLSDVSGSTLYWRYQQEQNQAYPQDIHYVSPQRCAELATPRACNASLDEYAARIAFTYEAREDVFESYAAGFRVATGLRLSRVTMTAAQQKAGERFFVRRYHFAYDASSFHSLLTHVQLEGRPESYDVSAGAMVGDLGLSERALPNDIVGALSPPLRFEYTRAPGGANQVAGFGGIDATVRSASVPRTAPSADNALTEFQDVNSDGLPDLVVTNPAQYRTPDGQPAVGVFFNGFSGREAVPAQAGTFSEAVSVAVDPRLSNVLSFANPEIVSMDVDGDGRTDLLHMPRRFEYGFFTPTRAADGPIAPVSPRDQNWRFTYARVALDRSAADARVDLGTDGPFVRTFDVNGDHLVDVVRTTGNAMQTWLNLGWLPGGEGRFGSATYDGREWQLSTLPYESCLLRWGNLPVDFSDPNVKLADMNGDGRTDVVLVRDNRVVFWAGRGVGLWGDGENSCARGASSPAPVVMENPPRGVFDTSVLQLHDVNMDGAADLLAIGYDSVSVWFSRAGRGFSEPLTVRGTPRAPDFASNVRVLDIDGSATDDIVWANAGRFQYVDMMAGNRPRLLERVHNGLGGLTTLTYGTSAEDYLRDLRAAESCVDSSCDRFTWSRVEDACDELLLERAGECVHRAGGSPVISTVVRTFTTSDQFERLGLEPNVVRASYAYHDGYYEGFAQEFRGFGAADLIGEGDATQPSLITRSWVHQGRRPSEIASERLAENPYEALKGFVYLAEVFDARGVYQSSKHSSYVVRTLYEGLDGKPVLMAKVAQGDELLYDTAPFSPGSEVVTVPSVSFERALEDGSVFVERADAEHRVRVRGQRHALLRATTDTFDNLGHALVQTNHGRVRGERGEAVHEPISTHSVFALVNPEAGIYRATRTWISGHGLDAARDGYDSVQVTDSRYDERGNEVYRAQEVRVPRTLTFRGDGRAEAFTQANHTVVSSQRFDAWGNPIAHCAGADLSAGAAPTSCLRYQEFAYDSAYGQLQVATRTAVARRAGAFRFLAVSQSWDRGTGKPLTETDANGLVTESGYDGTGRVTYIRMPPAAEHCAESPLPAQRFAYADAPEGLPIRITYSYSHNDCTNLTDEANITEERVYEDGVGRERASLVRSGAGQWVKSGHALFNARGEVARVYQPAFVASIQPSAQTVLAIPDTPHADVRRDGFGRVIVETDEVGAETQYAFHALSTDVSDPLDLSGDPVFSGTPATERMDGHGRVINRVLRNRFPDRPGIEYYQLHFEYRADGALTRITRAKTSSDAYDAVREKQVARVLTYDSLGRRIAASAADTDSPNGNTWRYLYNAVGDTVAVRDPRGCGQNLYFDFAGRLRGEDYVSCGEAQLPSAMAPYSTDDDLVGLTVGPARALDTVHYYDTLPPWASGALAPPSSYAQGEQTGSADRAQQMVVGYGARGHTTFVARQMAVVPEPLDIDESLASPPTQAADPAPLLQLRSYDPTTYVKRVRYDHAGRARELELPPAPDWNDTNSFGPTVKGRIHYDTRGLPTRAEAEIGGVTHVVIADVVYGASGETLEVVYGDDHDGQRVPTTSLFEYDDKQRLRLSTTTRAPTEFDTGNRPLGAVTRPFAHAYTWDDATNLTEVRDERYAREWPAGYRPQRTRIFHDALYRVTNSQFSYLRDGSDGGLPGWSLVDEATDWRSELERVNRDGRTHGSADPMRTRPAPMVSSLEGVHRVADLTWDWDWLGNMTESTDDASVFYERSLGRITNGYELSQRPSALYLASNLPTQRALVGEPVVDRGGWVEVDYGTSGNVVAFTVHGQCHDQSASVACFDPSNAALSSRRSTMRSSCACAVEQHYQYRWDELNRLSEARRFDRSFGVGEYELAARHTYSYDSANERVVKYVSGVDGEPDRATLTVFGGDYERRGVRPTPTGYEHDVELGTEDDYLIAGARIVWARQPNALGRALDRDARLVVSLSDVIQTTAATLDLQSGELLEYSTYYPNGARETYRAQDKVSIAPEPRGFTGKEADEEVGLVYFGQRYLIPRLGRWASPDPAEVHAFDGGEALNHYHYVSGNLLQARDPLGLKAADTRQVRGQIEYRLPDNKWTTSSSAFKAAWLAHGFTGHMRSELQGIADLLDMSVDDLIALAEGIAADPLGFATDVLEGFVEDLTSLAKDGWTALTSEGSERYEAIGRLAAKGTLALVGALMGGGGGKLAQVALKKLGSKGRKFVEKFASSMRGACGKRNSFAASTLIMTSSGAQPIETIEEGDLVWAAPEDGGEPSYKRVTGTISKWKKAVLALEVMDEDGEAHVIETTADHPFAAHGRGWVEAYRLSDGDQIYTFAGGWLQVTGGSWVRREQLVYNLEVADYHTFFLAETGAWVHNQKLCDISGAGKQDSWLKHHNDGHVLNVHTGKGDAAIQDRLRKDARLTSHGSFRSVEQAEAVTRKTIRQNRDQLSGWMREASPGQRTKLQLTPDGTSTGRGMVRGDSGPYEVINAEVIVERTKRGYQIITAYPKP